MKMLVITLGEMEAANFGREIIEALSKAGVEVQGFSIGTMSPPVYGVVYFGPGWTPEAAEILRRINVTANKSAMPFLPIPGSIQSRYAGIPAILVGLKPPP
jgi:hypothetical protein